MSLTERILVIPEGSAFSSGRWTGFNTDLTDRITRLAISAGIFLPRQEMETNPSYKQIIPYVVFRFGDKYLLMQRKPDHTEQRLASKMSLGIGGHVREEDLERSGVVGWARREFEEEVEYQGNLTFSVLGVLYDGSDDVGRVHLGIVILAEGDSDDIKIKDEHKMGELRTLSEIQNNSQLMENWSKLVFDYLKNEEIQKGIKSPSAV